MRALGFQSCHSRRAAPRRPPARLRASRGNENFYEVLGLTKNATEAEVKARYRELQRQYHPDIAGDKFREMSAKVNRAYDVLTSKRARTEYDRLISRTTGSGAVSLEAVEGLTGPLHERAVPVLELEVPGLDRENAVDWLQQWGTTIAFGCEVPFPQPLQCDRVDAGVRIAFVSASGGSIRVLGDLYLEIEALGDEELANGNFSGGLGGGPGPLGGVGVLVTRVSVTPDERLPGEDMVLSKLKNALRSKRARGESVELQGFWATAAAGLLGFLPLVHFGEEDTTYDSYRIPQRCNLDAHDRQQK